MEKDDKSELVKKLAEKVAAYEKMVPAMPEKVLKVIRDETEKLKTLEVSSPEFSVTRSYLDWLTNIPWETQTKDCLNISLAKTILNRDHFGLTDIKKRILEFIAVAILRRKLIGKIMCFIGPPGVGKTSIAKSISHALGRNFYRFSVGGLTDVAEIKGHRRTVYCLIIIYVLLLLKMLILMLILLLLLLLILLLVHWSYARQAGSVLEVLWKYESVDFDRRGNNNYNTHTHTHTHTHKHTSNNQIVNDNYKQ